LQALDKRQALLCILSENCDEPMYKKLVTALCMEHGIPLLKVSSLEILCIS
jgi:small subunit ribosomal protein S12e